jgi:hypothetical protein
VKKLPDDLLTIAIICLLGLALSLLLIANFPAAFVINTP